MSGLALAATHVTNSLARQEIAIAAVKQQLDAQEAVADLVAQAVESGAQTLNSSGPGQVVNLVT